MTVGATPARRRAGVGALDARDTLAAGAHRGGLRLPHRRRGRARSPGSRRRSMHGRRPSRSRCRRSATSPAVRLASGAVVPGQGGRRRARVRPARRPRGPHHRRRTATSWSVPRDAPGALAAFVPGERADRDRWRVARARRRCRDGALARRHAPRRRGRDAAGGPRCGSRAWCAITTACPSGSASPSRVLASLPWSAARRSRGWTTMTVGVLSGARRRVRRSSSRSSGDPTATTAAPDGVRSRAAPALTAVRAARRGRRAVRQARHDLAADRARASWCSRRSRARPLTR